MQNKHKPTHFWRTTWRLISYMSPWKGLMFIATIATTISMTLQIIAPRILGTATTVIYAGIKKGIRLKSLGHSVSNWPLNYGVIGHILLMVGIMYLVALINSIIQQTIINSVAQKAVFRLRKALKTKLARLPVEFYDHHDNGDIMSRAVNDMDDISTMLQTNLSQFLISVVMFLGVLVMMLRISLILTVVALVTVPASGLIIRFVVPQSQKYFASQQHHLGLLNNQVEENFGGHDVIKTFNREKTVEKKFAQENHRYYQAAWRAQFFSILMFPVTIVIKNLDYVFIAIVGGMQVINGNLPLGDVQAFLQYTNMFSQPITQLANLTSTIQYTIASAERVFEILDEPEMSNQKTKIPNEQTDDIIKFENVDFQYLPDKPLIRNFNLNVKPGQTIAIVGPTGAGKSTIINLLERFYEIKGGHIRFHGIDIRNLTRNELREKTAIVAQNSWLFRGTIADNLQYGNLTATPEDIKQAAKDSHAADFIKQLPHGYQTLLTENADNLSQGQRQLLTIARAFLAKPEILILDEATSSVDTQTEKQIQNAMQKLIHQSTSFVIAHRLSTIQNADQIIVLNHGQIIETGTHHQLLAEHGFYYHLYESQFVNV